MAAHSSVDWLRWTARLFSTSLSLLVLAGAAPAEHKQQAQGEFDTALARGRAVRDHNHDYLRAIRDFQEAERAAAKAGNPGHQALAWLSIANCDIRLYRLNEVFIASSKGYEYAKIAGDDTWAGVATSYLTDAYRLLGELGLAEKYAFETIRLLANSSRQEYVASALNNLFYMRVQQGRLEEGLVLSDRALAVERTFHISKLEILSLDTRAFILLHHNRTAEADAALKQARAVIAETNELEFLPIIEERQGEVQSAKGNYAKALQLSDHALANQTNEFRREVLYYYVSHVRARIFLGLKDKQRALGELRHSVAEANEWRQAALPGDSTSTQTTVFLDDVYRDFAELAAELSLSEHNPALAREGLEALAQNRAASLREQLTLALAKQSRLDERYFDLLSRIQDLQARVTLGHGSAQDVARLNDARLELSEIENSALALPASAGRPAHQTVRDIQMKLRDSELLLSFCLGEGRSYLWSITATSLNLYELPASGEIARQAKEFTQAVESRRDTSSAGNALSQSLFGPLNAREWGKRDWLITQDGAMVDAAPYSALPDGSEAHRGQLLIANHSLRSLPSELLLLVKVQTPSQHRFVGVADPIYNLADSRRVKTAGLVKVGDAGSAGTLGRLVGSEHEVRSAEQVTGGPDAQILAGPDATGLELQKALRKEPPELIHLAVHVVSPEGKPQEAALALSLTKENVPELVTREMVATYHVPGSLVVLSGCASGQGRALPSAGLIGLSRAWLSAGAAAVVVSSWPVPDDSGAFFSSFYTHLRSATSGSTAERAAVALEQAQLDMKHGSGYRNSPSFWAAYSIVSKE